MRKLKLLFPLLAASLVLAGCSNKDLPKPTGDGSISASWVDYNIPIVELDFNSSEQSISLFKGETHQYKFTYAPSNATLSQLIWSSSDAEVASVSSTGLLTANKGGHTTISVSSSAEVPWTAKTLEVEVLTKLESFSIAEEELDLDYNQEYTLNVSFTPSDASDKKLVFESDDPTIATVTNGKVTAKANDGSCNISVTSEQLPGVEKKVKVNVSDKTVHVESVEVVLPQTTLEVNKQITATAVVNPADAKEYLENGVTFETSTPEYINIDAKSGVISAKEPGTAKIKAVCESVESEEVSLEIFEIVPSSLIIVDASGSEISGSTINLNNSEGHSTYQILHKYVNSESAEVYPSRPNIEYESTNTNVATVNQQGLISILNGGEADVIIRDNRYMLGAQIHVVVTINALSITLQTQGTALGIGKTMTLTCSITPSNVTDASVTYSINSNEHATLHQETGSNIATLTGVSKGDVIVTVKTGDVEDSKTISVDKIPGVFKEGVPYVVGSADFSSGTSIGSEASWDDADLAFEITENVTDPIYTVQKHAQITFRANDEWKVRVGDVWPESDHYERTGGNAFDAGQMEILPEGGNVRVIEAGMYDIYYKIYQDTGYEAIYVKKSAPLSIDKQLLYVAVDATGTITASNVAGVLKATANNSNVSVSVNGNVVNVTGVTVGDSKVTISDNLNSVVCNIKVTAAPVSTYKITYYVPDSLDETYTAFSSHEVELPNGENLYTSLASATSDINGFKFSAWHESNEHFRTDDPDYDVIPNSVTISGSMSVYAKYIKENELYYYHTVDQKDYYVSESIAEYGLYASTVYYGTRIYSYSGIEGVGVDLGIGSGVYKFTKNTSDWTITRKVGFGVNDVAHWWFNDGRHTHIYCFGDGIEDTWISNVTFSDNVYSTYFDIKYTGFILVRSTASKGSWGPDSGVENQTVDIKLNVAGGNGETYSVGHTTAFVQNSTDGGGKQYYNWW